MLSTRKAVLISLILAITLLAGCSGGKSPVMPSPASNFQPSATHNSTGDNSSNYALWGMWYVNIDPVTMTAEINPLRGAMFTANVTTFMQPPSSPIHMINFQVDMVGSDPLNGYFKVEVTMRHPFPAFNYYNGFDVRGILMSDGSVTGNHDPGVVMAGDGDTRLDNPDGYTRFWNWVEFTSYETILGATQGKLAPPSQPNATVNAYKYFADGLESEDTVESVVPLTRGFFTTGGANTRRYEIQFKMDGGNPVFDFNYAVDASWSEPDDSYLPDYPVEAFPITANCAEAYHLVANDAGSTAWYVDPSTNGGELVLDIEVFDHQGAVNPSGVPGEISGIWLEGDVLADPVDVLDTATILPGSSFESSVFQVTLTSLNLTSSGTTEFFCTVESADPLTYEPQIEGGDMFDYPDAHLSAYFTFNAYIDNEEPWQPPTPPTTPVCIDPDVATYGVQFAIASDGLIHSVYIDFAKENAYWSYSSDLGNTWVKGNSGNPIYTVESGHSPPYQLVSNGICMDANGDYVYVILSENDNSTPPSYGTRYCKLVAGRLDINVLSAGWETIDVWSSPDTGDGRDNFGRPALSVMDDGSIMLVGLYYSNYGGGFHPSYSYASSWANLQNIPRQSITLVNGFLVYIYPRSTTCLVNDGSYFYYTTGGYFNDYDYTAYGTGKMNSIMRFDPGGSNWRFVQTTAVPNQSNSYQHFYSRGLAIDSSDNLHWVYGYAYNNTGDNNYGRNYGDWEISYGTGAASGDHDFAYTEPITETYHHRSLAPPGYYYACNDFMFYMTSIAVDSTGGVLICYQSAVNDRIIYGIRNDGSGWTDPVEIEGPSFYGHYPFGRMHQTDYLMISFTDLEYPSGGTGNPYFVAWQ